MFHFFFLFFLSLVFAVAPTHVTITGATEARVGDVVPLQCTTAPSNPPAEIKWMVAGKQIRNATSKTVVSPEGMLNSVISLIQHVQLDETTKCMIIAHSLTKMLTIISTFMESMQFVVVIIIIILVFIVILIARVRLGCVRA